jgi:hypothetical protein
MTSPFPELGYEAQPVHAVVPSEVDWNLLMSDDSAMLVELSARCWRAQFIAKLAPFVTNVPNTVTQLTKTLTESLKNSRRLRNMFPISFQAPKIKKEETKPSVTAAIGDILSELTDLQLLYVGIP